MKQKEKLFEEATELTKSLHFEMFPEEYDFISDSGVDAKQRQMGINPMSKEYIERVNAKRHAMGVSPLAKNGLCSSNETFDLLYNEAVKNIQNMKK